MLWDFYYIAYSFLYDLNECVLKVKQSWDLSIDCFKEHFEKLAPPPSKPQNVNYFSNK